MKSFYYAFRGIFLAVKTERNMRIHLAAVAAVTALGVWFRIERWEWAAVILSCGLVIGAELLNTALEKFCDKVSPERSEEIRAVKDIAAGAVLVSAIAAAGVGIAVFWGYII